MAKSDEKTACERVDFHLLQAQALASRMRGLWRETMRTIPAAWPNWRNLHSPVLKHSITALGHNARNVRRQLKFLEG
jgi:hypothetical protein